MTQNEENMIYHAMQAITDNAKMFCDLANKSRDHELRKAYREGVYSPAITLQVILGSEAIKRCDKERKEMHKKMKEYMQSVSI